jgi:site-specific DNA recombinase
MTEPRYPKRSGRRPSREKKVKQREGLLRVATYTRISTDEVNQPYSLQAQAQMLGKYIEFQPDMMHVASYTDQKSGATLERPQLKRLLADAKTGAFDVVLVYRLDRLARSLGLVHQIFDQLQQAEVGLRSATESFDTITAGGRMMMNILGTFAQFERDVLIDRITAGMRTKAARGEWPGGQPPYGYRIADGKTLEVVEAEAAVVRRIFSMVDEERLGSLQITARLNESGARTLTGQHWSFKRVLDVLRRPTYAGWIVRNDETFEGKHEAIIDRETFDRVQGILDERSDHSVRQASSDYLLSGLLRCSICGRTLVGVSAHSKGNKYRYYICAGRNEKGPVSCAASRLSADALEQMVRDQIVQLYGRYDLFQEAASRAMERRNTRLPLLAAEIDAARDGLVKIEMAIARYFTAFEQGSMPEALCAERVRDLCSKAESQRVRVAELELELTAAAPKLPKRKDLAQLREQVVEALSRPPTPALRAFLASVIDRIEVGADRRVECFLRVPNSGDAIVRPTEAFLESNEPGTLADPGSHALSLGGAGGNRTPVR